jgi:hypothetical protein
LGERARSVLEEIPGMQPGQLVTMPVEDWKIVRRLEQDAEKGSTQAAQTLLRWRELYPAETQRVDISGLTEATRQPGLDSWKPTVGCSRWQGRRHQRSVAQGLAVPAVAKRGEEWS